MKSNLSFPLPNLPLLSILQKQKVQPSLIAALSAILLGSSVGIAATFEPGSAGAGLAALLLGFALLTSTTFGFTLVFALITLLPFGTLPFKAILTPTFLELALALLLCVWVLRLLARSETYDLRFPPFGFGILGFLGLTFFSLLLGAGGMPDSLTLHNYAKFILGVLFYFSVVNCVRTPQQVRLALQTLLIFGGLMALLGLIFYALNAETALRLLTSLGRIGYPTSGRVLRYVEDDPSGLERAIGTSVDPNSFGGMLALLSSLAIAQFFTNRPLLSRWLLTGIVGLMVITLLLTFSRAALIGFGAAMVYLALLRYRRLWWGILLVGMLAGVVLSSLGMAEGFAQRFAEGVQFQDQAQQMRLAEYQNALNIIARYPLFGIGFGQAPEIDLVAGVSSIYLALAERLGLLGLTAFLSLVSAWFGQTFTTLRQPKSEESGWMLGLQAGIVAALTVGIADHYFFNIEFSHMVTLFWGCLGLGSAIRGLEPEVVI